MASKKEKKEKITEEVVDEILDEAIEDGLIEEKPVEKKEYAGDLRGFKSLEIAKNYPNTPEFKKLDIGCRTEYQNWLKSILEEE